MSQRNPKKTRAAPPKATEPKAEASTAEQIESPQSPGETPPAGGDWLGTLVRNPVAWIVAVVLLLLAGIGIPTILDGAKPTPTATATRLPDPTATPAPVAGCTVVSLLPTPGPTEQSLFPDVTEKDWSRGPLTASVTIIEYSDFQ